MQSSAFWELLQARNVDCVGCFHPLLDWLAILVLLAGTPATACTAAVANMALPCRHVKDMPSLIGQSSYAGEL